ncbi:MAG: S1C family serine protease, partial [Gaiellaceae bacterium]
PKAATNRGIVDIYTSLDYTQSAAAGTGMVLSSSGLVLTNNHVIRGATHLNVVVVANGKRYAAYVVGYDVPDDVAVLQLERASQLATMTFGNSAKLRRGQAVRAIGNAGGKGGKPTVAAGKVTALHRVIVAVDGEGGSERLTNLIATNANVQPGDSGGPLVDGAGRVVGIVTAGSSGFALQTNADRGYAIPVNKARSIARQMVLGHASPRIHLGPTAFLGVSIDSHLSGGAGVYSVVPGLPGDATGLVQGDVITSLNGTTIASLNDLQAALIAITPGQTVPIEWQDAFGSPHSGTIVPASGPPQ